MTPRFLIDRGTATHSAAVVARLNGRWRLVDAAAFPAAIETEHILGFLAERIAGLAETLPEVAEVAGGWRDWQRIEAVSAPPKRIALLAANERCLGAIDVAATQAGWRIAARIMPERPDALEATDLLADVELDALALAAGDPPDSDEQRALPELGALAGAVAGGRDDVVAVLCGAAVEQAERFPVERVVLAPAPPGPVPSPSGTELVRLLLALGGQGEGARLSAGRAVATLAAILERTVELVDVGYSGGAWFRASAPPPDQSIKDGDLEGFLLAAGSFVLDHTSDEADDDSGLDAVMAWSPLHVDRPTHRDRLSELRTQPWHEASGEGALLRMAAARAALDRLEGERVRLGGAPPERMGAPDLLVVAGGAMAVAPAPAIALAAADTVRRPGMMEVAFDHARVLAPLGMLPEAERREVVAELADDLLLPVGSVLVLAAGRPGREAGRLQVSSAGLTSGPHPLASGALRLVELAPGAEANLEVELRDGRFGGAPAHRLGFQTTGGLGGLLVDTRGIPLRLPQRSERRREVLAEWQRSLWPGADS